MGGAAALFHAAQGLLLQGGDAPRLVARAGVLVHREAQVGVILWKAENQPPVVLEDFPAGAAVHQQLLGAEHLRHLGEHGAAPRGDDPVPSPGPPGGWPSGRSTRPSRRTLNPMRSLDRGACSRRNPRAFSAKPFRISSPAASSSSASWQLRKAMLSRWKGERACRMPSRELFSQAQPHKQHKGGVGVQGRWSTAAFGCSPRPPPAGSSQTGGAGRRCHPKSRPPRAGASWASRWQMGFTHPTVGRM